MIGRVKKKFMTVVNEMENIINYKKTLEELLNCRNEVETLKYNNAVAEGACILGLEMYDEKKKEVEDCKKSTSNKSKGLHGFDISLSQLS